MTWDKMSERERDALVAEKVFGWHKFVGAINCEECGRLFLSNKHYNADAPHYRTDISVAWTVVEKITEPPTTLELSKEESGTKFAIWFDKANLWAMNSREVSEAICEAALKAKGVEI